MSVFFPLQGQHWTRIVTITGQFVPLTLSTSPYRSGILILLFMAMEFYCPDDLNISSHIKKNKDSASSNVLLLEATNHFSITRPATSLATCRSVCGWRTVSVEFFIAIHSPFLGSFRVISKSVKCERSKDVRDIFWRYPRTISSKDVRDNQRYPKDSILPLIFPYPATPRSWTWASTKLAMLLGEGKVLSWLQYHAVTWRFPEIGVPPVIIHFWLVFSIINHPLLSTFILGNPKDIILLMYYTNVYL